VQYIFFIYHKQPCALVVYVALEEEVVGSNPNACSILVFFPEFTEHVEGEGETTHGETRAL
jgi:hypothetical protein